MPQMPDMPKMPEMPPQLTKEQKHVDDILPPKCTNCTTKKR